MRVASAALRVWMRVRQRGGAAFRWCSCSFLMASLASWQLSFILHHYFDSSFSPSPAVYRYWALKTPPTSHRPTTSTSAFFASPSLLPLTPPLPPPPPPLPVFSIYGPEFVPGYNGADYRRPSGTAPQARREPDASNWSLLIRLTACSDRLSTKSDNCE